MFEKDEVRARLLGIWKQVLGTDSVGLNEDFFELGGSSIQIAQLVACIEHEFAIKLNPALLWEHRTVAAHADVLLQGVLPYRDLTSLVCIQPFGSTPPIFFLHTHGGTVSYCPRFARFLGDQQPVYGFQSRALSGGPAHLSISEMASYYLGELRLIQPDGPYHFFGYCSGGLIAFEMALQLARQGETIGFLGMMNTPAPGSFRVGLPGLFLQVMDKTKTELRKLKSVEPSQRVKRLAHKTLNFGRLVRKYWKAELWRSETAALRKKDPQRFAERLAELYYINSIALREYRPSDAASLPITFFRSPNLEDEYSVSPVEGWTILNGHAIELVHLPQEEDLPLDDRQLQLISDRIKLSVASPALVR